eukprot:gnl/Chilomastix_cuspidata/980.p1 GENE.gnl/Chilomastix_cuspidata/980~~gnl/Chilomastix_cuspidata/980.p1  ORF type:complete len:1230 (+),score=361.12 gnl/Chilomastix_cuspidata/980:2480-6169(+)
MEGFAYVDSNGFIRYNFDISTLGKEDECDDDELLCGICYMKVFDPITPTNCEHLFCRQCLTAWLETSVSCPLCRSVCGEVRAASQNIVEQASMCVCPHPGCHFVAPLSHMADHFKKCQFRCPRCEEFVEGPEAPLHNVTCTPRLIRYSQVEYDLRTQLEQLLRTLHTSKKLITQRGVLSGHMLRQIAGLPLASREARNEARARIAEEVKCIRLEPESWELIDDRSDIFPFFLSALADIPFQDPPLIEVKGARTSQRSTIVLPGLFFRALARMRLSGIRLYNVQKTQDAEAEALFVESTLRGLARAREEAREMKRKGASSYFHTPPQYIFDALPAKCRWNTFIQPLSRCSMVRLFEETLLRFTNSALQLPPNAAIDTLVQISHGGQERRKPQGQHGPKKPLQKILINDSVSFELFSAIASRWILRTPGNFSGIKFLEFCTSTNFHLEANELQKLTDALRRLTGLRRMGLTVYSNNPRTSLDGFLEQVLSAVSGNLKMLSIPLVEGVGLAREIQLISQRFTKLRSLEISQMDAPGDRLIPLLPFMRARVEDVFASPALQRKHFKRANKQGANASGFFTLQSSDTRFLSFQPLELALAELGASFEPARCPNTGQLREPLFVRGSSNWAALTKALRGRRRVRVCFPYRMSFYNTLREDRFAFLEHKPLYIRPTQEWRFDFSVLDEMSAFAACLDSIPWWRIARLEFPLFMGGGFQYGYLALYPEDILDYEAIASLLLELVEVRKRTKKLCLAREGRPVLRALEGNAVFDITRGPCAKLGNINILYGLTRILPLRGGAAAALGHLRELRLRNFHRMFISSANAPYCFAYPLSEILDALPNITRISFVETDGCGRVLAPANFFPSIMMSFLLKISRLPVEFRAAAPFEDIVRGLRSGRMRYRGPASFLLVLLHAFCPSSQKTQTPHEIDDTFIERFSQEQAALRAADVALDELCIESAPYVVEGSYKDNFELELKPHNFKLLAYVLERLRPRRVALGSVSLERVPGHSAHQFQFPFTMAFVHFNCSSVDKFQTGFTRVARYLLRDGVCGRSNDPLFHALLTSSSAVTLLPPGVARHPFAQAFADLVGSRGSILWFPDGASANDLFMFMCVCAPNGPARAVVVPRCLPNGPGGAAVHCPPQALRNVFLPRPFRDALARLGAPRARALEELGEAPDVHVLHAEGARADAARLRVSVPSIRCGRVLSEFLLAFSAPSLQDTFEPVFSTPHSLDAGFAP